jgi:hypothetical protein
VCSGLFSILLEISHETDESIGLDYADEDDSDAGRQEEPLSKVTKLKQGLVGRSILLPGNLWTD